MIVEVGLSGIDLESVAICKETVKNVSLSILLALTLLLALFYVWV